MDIIRAILDGIMMAVYFNGLAAVFILINSRYFFSSYPKSIQQAAPNPATKEEKKAGAKIMCFFAFAAVSLWSGQRRLCGNERFLDAVPVRLHQLDDRELR